MIKAGVVFFIRTQRFAAFWYGCGDIARYNNDNSDYYINRKHVQWNLIEEWYKESKSAATTQGVCNHY